MEDVLVPLIVFGSITAIIIFTFSRRHRERMEMIRTGINPLKLFPPRTGGKSLFWGLLFIAIGLAMLISALVIVKRFNEGLALWGIVVLFSGIAFLLFWKMTAKYRERAMRAYEQSLAEENKKPEQEIAQSADET